MKKIILVITVLMLTAGLTFAQNSSSTSTTGNSNLINVTQATDLQDSEITIMGNENDTKVDQFSNNGGINESDVLLTGDRNKSTVYMDQIGGGTPSTNTVMLSVTGNDNVSYQSVFAPGYNGGQHLMGTVTGYENDLNQRIQSGHTETFEAIQMGSRNEIDQIMPYGSHQHGKVVQDGQENYARQYFEGANNGYFAAPSGGPVTIDQTGYKNSAYQTFHSTGGSSDGNSGWLRQNGDRNLSYQIVDGWSMDLKADVYGADNYTRQSVVDEGHLSDVLLDGARNDVRTVQSGYDNETKVRINQYHHGWASDNDVDVIQSGEKQYFQLTIGRGDEGGDNNKVRAIDEGLGQYHRISIDGSSNDIRVHAVGNTGGTEYSGNRGDWSFSDSDPVWNETSDENFFRLNQDGSRNYATGKVAGDRNDIRINQTGEDNLVGTSWYTTDGLVLSGDDNTVRINQTGLLGNQTFNNVVGNGNTINVNQSN